MKKVVILQHRLLHYRTGMFDQLRSACAEHNIDLMLVHGQATRREMIKRDEGNLPWAIKVQNKVWEVGARDVIWQPFPEQAKGADLVILMQESRILSNYPLLLSRLWGVRKVAYWGHGKNFQSQHPSGLRETWKNLLLKQVDWWFSYTCATTNIIESAGYRRENITQLDNAIDSEGFKKDLASWSDDEVIEGRKQLGIEQNAPVGIFCGSLYPDKRLDLLISASDLIRQEIPNFNLLVIGDGPSMPELIEAKVTRPWIHLLGVQKGREKARYFRMSDVMLNPGLVGLHIVDAFCAGLVMITTDNAKHSPEVAYLTNKINGLMVSDNPAEYAASVASLLKNQLALAQMKSHALADSKRYTQENMIKRFTEGIVKATSNK
ncbi:glycosyltransferase family 4 protein [Sphaerotilus mobilis]|uniref:Glycosyltransferase involved in cell wall biosynthesis n=1 Tax=Sphaerotilus mobilis TaxID=47994 RepID=A0A4Q7LV81_9BURK|nr:glycosyltransferase family 4 protein [Sphaerotilus mobilis]RZS58192.1 glycosyltransferase involved in cell wall biosynthesis [Sphaerotilus mobilis]